MIEGTALAADFGRNLWIIEQQAAGLTHADSLLQTPYRINCLNWTLGHILEGRGVVLDLIGAERAVAADATERYRRESDPILEDGPGVLALDDLLAGLRETQDRLSAALAGLDEGALAAESDRGDGEMVPLWAKVHFQYFHDTYHTGQTELLRQVTGMGDKVI